MALYNATQRFAVLRLVGAKESGIAPPAFRTLLEDHLRTSPPAWDRYRLDR
jgi:hypothetical protein